MAIEFTNQFRKVGKGKLTLKRKPKEQTVVDQTVVDRVVKYHGKMPIIFGRKM